MDMQGWVANQTVAHWGWITTSAGTALSAGVVMAVKAVKKRIKLFDHLMTNCIPTIQKRLTEVGEGVAKVGERQDRTNLELAEQTGVLKTIASLLER